MQALNRFSGKLGLKMAKLNPISLSKININFFEKIPNPNYHIHPKFLSYTGLVLSTTLAGRSIYHMYTNHNLINEIDEDQLVVNQDIKKCKEIRNETSNIIKECKTIHEEINDINERIQIKIKDINKIN
jgi:hypothetical protein